MSSARQSLNRMARRNRLEAKAAKPKPPAPPAPSPTPDPPAPPVARARAPLADRLAAGGVRQKKAKRQRAVDAQVEHAARSPLSLKPSPRPEPPPRPDTVDELVGRCTATDEEADLTACYRDRELATCPRCTRTFCENCLPQHIASRHGRSHV